jgi:nitrate reductase assembly molybdenum cofactor insertion protein NarJ
MYKKINVEVEVPEGNYCRMFDREFTGALCMFYNNNGVQRPAYLRHL